MCDGSISRNVRSVTKAKLEGKRTKKEKKKKTKYKKVMTGRHADESADVCNRSERRMDRPGMVNVVVVEAATLF